MDDVQIINELLKRSEGSATLDFKSKPHRLDKDNKHYQAQFIKDIICMANTPREGSAYILVGVWVKPDYSKELINITEHPNDSIMQQLICSRTRIVPHFQYRSVTYEGKSLGIIEVFPDHNGPYVTTWSYENTLHEGSVYFRRGSENAQATPEEIIDIVTWMKSEPKIVTPQIIKSDTSIAWETFYSSCNRFDDNWLYCLIIGPAPELSEDQKKHWVELTGGWLSISILTPIFREYLNLQKQN